MAGCGEDRAQDRCHGDVQMLDERVQVDDLTFDEPGGAVSVLLRITLGVERP